ncbi:Lrp/AsnC family transcriptional regulator [Sphingomonas jeddahensis]|uniref:Leucine-responsive regulatory protein n=1 Tax=Sphingomonas jeddahensis TaxID=1915074 RepID=A0A1V2EWE8_9SPHN|nr:Lrp/AsnC family transcriptional regulator [Sphingomonas jeddahensis]ONF96863.1 Leucine-responsive regulatory protein [Sphingomonas jeddahensis]
MNRIDKRLDDTDRRIVAILATDARRPAAAIARDLHLSRTAVQARLARLERDGVILGYATLVAPDTIGRVSAFVTLSIGVRPCARVIDQLRGWPQIERIFSIAGDRDAVLLVSADSPQALSGLADRLSGLDGVTAVETTVILSEHRRSPPAGAPLT